MLRDSTQSTSVHNNAYTITTNTVGSLGRQRQLFSGTCSDSFTQGGGGPAYPHLPPKGGRCNTCYSYMHQHAGGVRVAASQPVALLQAAVSAVRAVCMGCVLAPGTAYEQHQLIQDLTHHQPTTHSPLLLLCTGAACWLQRVPLSSPLRMCCGVAQRVSTAFALLPLLLLVIWRKVRPAIIAVIYHYCYDR